MNQDYIGFASDASFCQKEQCEMALRRPRLLLFWFLFCLGLSGCAYHFGNTDRVLPGGYKQVTIPIFKNYTQEPGIEVAFTNALIRQFETAQVARVVDPNQAEVIIEGEINAPADQQMYLAATPNPILNPVGTVLAPAYLIQLGVHIRIKRRSDKSVIWEGSFAGQRTYNAPQVITASINTVNPLYNLSARRQNIDVIASDMMAEAHSRMTENF